MVWQVPSLGVSPNEQGIVSAHRWDAQWQLNPSITSVPVCVCLPIVYLTFDL